MHMHNRKTSTNRPIIYDSLQVQLMADLADRLHLRFDCTFKYLQPVSLGLCNTNYAVGVGQRPGARVSGPQN